MERTLLHQGSSSFYGCQWPHQFSSLARRRTELKSTDDKDDNEYEEDDDDDDDDDDDESESCFLIRPDDIVLVRHEW